MLRKISLLIVGIGIGGISVATFSQSGLLTGSQAEAASRSTYKQLNLFGDVFERIRSDYVEEPADDKLVESAINGMLSALDPHSSYLTPKAYQDMQVQTRGEFGGLGIEVTLDEKTGFVKVVTPIADTPADQAGVLAGDLISHLDGKAIRGLTLNEAVEQMRGKVKTPLELTIVRENVKEPVKISVIRDVIKIRSVRGRVEGDVGYIRITQFNEQTFDGVKSEIEQQTAKIGANLKGFVLDLRNNPGGLLDQSIAVSDVFLDKGEIVSTRGRNAEETQRYPARSGDLTKGKPVVVIINGGSASASEIVSGALQDHRRATIIGSRSFGKGSVQTIVPLGSNGALRLTTARYYTPSGQSIQAKGIIPDIEVEQPLPDELKDVDVNRSEADLPRHLQNGEEKEEQKGSSAYFPRDPKDDKQLAYALDLLRGKQKNAMFPPDPNKGVPN
ncbi:MAG: S41 family peptidase [Rhizobiales bacterium]|nr:S41 family peptidase [Hyphomicrobiales bacterium]